MAAGLHSPRPPSVPLVGERNRMTDPNPTLRIGDADHELELVPSTIGDVGLDVRMLRGDTGYVTFDPGYANTASTESAITYIDGGNGTLWHRGYRIEDLAEQCGFLEVAYLLLFGELPDAGRLGGVAGQGAAPHVAQRGAQAVLRRLPPQRPPDGDPVLRHQRHLHVLRAVLQPEGPRSGAGERHPADRQDADGGRLGVQEVDRPALRLPAQRSRATWRTSST